MKKQTYIYAAIDLKSFYASVECKERNLDPLTTHLVVADASRSSKTICLAVSPSLKQLGISGRPRLFEVIQSVKELNQKRLYNTHQKAFQGTSYDAIALQTHTEYAIDYITAPPRMALYLQYSTNIYNIYLKYFAPEDIHVYSIDEVFIDLTSYLNHYHTKPEQLIRNIIQEILETTGITATAGIGTNLFLAKVAMDIVAKHIEPDQNGVRIACLNTLTYRKLLWNHQPLTDFWRVGKGYAKKLHAHHLYTMGDIAQQSIKNEDILFELFGKNAELLIDHAWGYEPCTIQAIKNYKPTAKSIGTGQVLHRPYTSSEARTVLWEMADQMALTLVEKQLKAYAFTITIGYDIDNLKNSSIRNQYQGKIKIDAYGRKIPEHAHGTTRFHVPTSSGKEISHAVIHLYDRINNPIFHIRRLNIAFQVMTQEEANSQKKGFEQLDLFTNIDVQKKTDETLKIEKEKENKIQETILQIKYKYGKNAILKATNLKKEATTKDRNQQIGGHKA